MGKWFANLAGKKTFILAGLQVLYAVSSATLGHITWDQAFQLIMQSGLVSALRHGIAASNGK